MYASGTCRTNRKHFPAYKLDEIVKNKGDAGFLYHGSLIAGKRLDKRDVCFMSTLYRGDMETITRRSQQGTPEIVTKPKIVCDYNNNMSGVDIADQIMVYYACGRRTLKWYKRVFWRLVEHIIVNASILFRHVCQPNLRQWTQKKFRIELVYTLVAPLIANKDLLPSTSSVSRENTLPTYTRPGSDV